MNAENQNDQNINSNDGTASEVDLGFSAFLDMILGGPEIRMAHYLESPEEAMESFKSCGCPGCVATMAEIAKMESEGGTQKRELPDNLQ